MGREIDLTLYANPVELIPATTTASPAPDVNSDVVQSREYDTVRTFLAYSGTVTSCVLRLWVFDRSTWYKAQNTTNTVPLEGSAFGNEVRDWAVGEQAEITFQVESITGGGSVTVKVKRGDVSG